MTHLREKVNNSLGFDLSASFITKPRGTLHLMIPEASHRAGQAQGAWNELPARVTPLTFSLFSTFSWNLILQIHSSDWWHLKSQIMERQTSYRCERVLIQKSLGIQMRLHSLQLALSQGWLACWYAPCRSRQTTKSSDISSEKKMGSDGHGFLPFLGVPVSMKEAKGSSKQKRAFIYLAVCPVHLEWWQAISKVGCYFTAC